MNYELIQNNSVPLCFNSFRILKKNFGQVLKDEYRNKQEISFESIQQSCQSFQDPIVDQLDGLCGQNHSSFTSHETKRCYDIDMVRQSDSMFFAAEMSCQKPSEHPQSYEEVLKDTEGIGEKSSFDA